MNSLYKVHLKHVSDQLCVFNYKLIMFVHYPVFLFVLLLSSLEINTENIFLHCISLLCCGLIYYRFGYNIDNIVFLATAFCYNA